MEGRPRRRNRRAGSEALTLACSVCLVLLFQLAGSMFSSPPARAADGLAPGVPVPAWAKKARWIHFDPAEPARDSTARRSAPAAGARMSPAKNTLTYRGGSVEVEPKLVLIFWGAGWGSARGVQLRDELEAMSDGLAGSGYQSLLGQYSGFAGPISAPPLDAPSVEVYDDPKALPADLTLDDFRVEARAVMRSQYGEIAGNRIFAVLPEPGASYPSGQFSATTCGWHSPIENQRNGTLEVGSYAAIIDTGGKFGCNSSKTLSHEYAESITDPNGSGWKAGEEEVADLCNSLTSEYMADGAHVNALWDDSKGACEVEDSSPGRVPIGPYVEDAYAGSAEITTESEKLESSLEPCGLEAHYRFEYGTTTAYGQRTGEATIPASWGQVEVQADLTGLQHSVGYDWRVAISTANGTVYGPNHKFTIPYYVEVRTEEPWWIEGTGAELRGAVEPAGDEATYYFEYGTTNAYGSKTAEASAGSGVGAVPVGAAVSGLQPETLYHFRLVASSSRGTSASEDRTFWTAGKPEAVTAAASEVGYTHATLHAAIAAKYSPTHFYFEYGDSEAYGHKTPEYFSGERNEPVEEHEAISGLSPDTTYHFRVVASNAYGATYGADQTFTTAEEPLVETGPPEAVLYNGATLTGSVSPRATDTKYYFEYGQSEQYGARTSPTDAGSGTEPVTAARSVNDLVEETHYHYRIVAVTAYGTTFGPDRIFSTSAQPSVPSGTGSGAGTTETLTQPLGQPPVSSPPPPPPAKPSARSPAAVSLVLTRFGGSLSVAFTLTSRVARLEATATVPAAQLGAGGRAPQVPVVGRVVRAGIAAGRSRLLLALDARGRSALRRRRRLTVTVTLAVVAPNHTRQTTKRTFVLHDG